MRSLGLSALPRPPPLALAALAHGPRGPHHCPLSWQLTPRALLSPVLGAPHSPESPSSVSPSSDFLHPAPRAGKKECARTWGWSVESQQGWGVAGTLAEDRHRSSTCRTRERGGKEIRSVQLGIHAASALRIQRERRILFITLALRIGLLVCVSIQKPDRWPSNGCLVHCVQPCP